MWISKKKLQKQIDILTESIMLINVLLRDQEKQIQEIKKTIKLSNELSIIHNDALIALLQTDIKKPKEKIK